MTLGGFIGNAMEVGVPGHDGPGEPIVFGVSGGNCERNPSSGGAGLLEEIRLPGKSIFKLCPIFFGSSLLSRLNCPSFVLRV